MKEKDFQTKVLKKLRELPNSWWVKTNDRVTAGLPDIIGCIHGKFFAFELKTTSRVTALQAYTIAKISLTGAIAEIVTPTNWKEIYKNIKAIAEATKK